MSMPVKWLSMFLFMLLLLAQTICLTNSVSSPSFRPTIRYTRHPATGVPTYSNNSLDVTKTVIHHSLDENYVYFNGLSTSTSNLYLSITILESYINKSTNMPIEFFVVRENGLSYDSEEIGRCVPDMLTCDDSVSDACIVNHRIPENFINYDIYEAFVLIKADIPHTESHDYCVYNSSQNVKAVVRYHLTSNPIPSGLPTEVPTYTVTELPSSSPTSVPTYNYAKLYDDFRAILHKVPVGGNPTVSHTFSKLGYPSKGPLLMRVEVLTSAAAVNNDGYVAISLAANSMSNIFKCYPNFECNSTALCLVNEDVSKFLTPDVGGSLVVELISVMNTGDSSSLCYFYGENVELVATVTLSSQVVPTPAPSLVAGSLSVDSLDVWKNEFESNVAGPFYALALFMVGYGMYGLLISRIRVNHKNVVQINLSTAIIENVFLGSSFVIEMFYIYFLVYTDNSDQNTIADYGIVMLMFRLCHALVAFYFTARIFGWFWLERSLYVLLDKTSYINHSSEYWVGMVLMYADCQLVRLLPWEPTAESISCFGYPTLFIFRVCLFTKLTQSIISLAIQCAFIQHLRSQDINISGGASTFISLVLITTIVAFTGSLWIAFLRGKVLLTGAMTSSSESAVEVQSSSRLSTVREYTKNPITATGNKVVPVGEIAPITPTRRASAIASPVENPLARRTSVLPKPSAKVSEVSEAANGEYTTSEVPAAVEETEKESSESNIHSEKGDS